MSEPTQVVTDTPNLELMPRADAPAIWNDFRAQAEKLKHTADTLVIKDVSDVAAMKIARSTRLAFREVRIAIEKRRKELGEFHLRETQKINAAAKELKELIEPYETRLLEQEQFAERVEAERKAALKAERVKALAQYGVDGQHFSLDIIPEDQYETLLSGAKATYEAKLAAAAKAEADRIAKEKAEAEERERIRKENERLQKEAVEREAKAKAEREKAEAEHKRLEAKIEAERKEAEAKAAAAKAKADEEARQAAEKAAKEREAAEAKAKKERAAVEAKAKQEREAREKAEAELAEKKRIEAKVKADREAAELAAKAAPDKEKLIALADVISNFTVPELSTEKGKLARTEIIAQMSKMVTWIEKKANEL